MTTLPSGSQTPARVSAAQRRRRRARCSEPDDRGRVLGQDQRDRSGPRLEEGARAAASGGELAELAQRHREAQPSIASETPSTA